MIRPGKPQSLRLYALSFCAIACMGLGGCATLFGHPVYDAATEQQLTAVKAEADQAYQKLATPPDCSLAANSSDLDKVASDLASLHDHVSGLAHNDHTTSGVASLQSKLSHDRAAYPAGAACLPAALVRGQQSAMDAGVDALVAYEQKKPRS